MQGSGPAASERSFLRYAKLHARPTPNHSPPPALPKPHHTLIGCLNVLLVRARTSASALRRATLISRGPTVNTGLKPNGARRNMVLTWTRSRNGSTTGDNQTGVPKKVPCRRSRKTQHAGLPVPVNPGRATTPHQAEAALAPARVSGHIP